MSHFRVKYKYMHISICTVLAEKKTYKLLEKSISLDCNTCFTFLQFSRFGDWREIIKSKLPRKL